MLEAIDRWENEGGAAPLMYPPQPLDRRVRRGASRDRMPRHERSRDASDYPQTGPEHPAPVTPGPSGGVQYRAANARRRG